MMADPDDPDLYRNLKFPGTSKTTSANISKGRMQSKTEMCLM
jgi:hypothetical protein